MPYSFYLPEPMVTSDDDHVDTTPEDSTTDEAQDREDLCACRQGAHTHHECNTELDSECESGVCAECHDECADTPEHPQDEEPSPADKVQSNQPSPAEGPSPGSKTKAAPSAAAKEPLYNQSQSMSFKASEADQTELRDILEQLEQLESNSAAKRQLADHVRQCHTLELTEKLNGKKIQCPHCVMSKMVDKGARQGSTREIHNLMTMSADTQILTHLRVNGNGVATQFVMYTTLCGVYLPGKKQGLGLNCKTVPSSQIVYRVIHGSRGQAKSSSLEA